MDGQHIDGGAGRVAVGLGCVSLALGAAGLVSPRGVARLIGIDDTDTSRLVIRATGLRELASGVAILSNPHSAGALWSRVGGTVMNLYALKRGAGGSAAHRDRPAAVAAGLLAMAAIDFAGAGRLPAKLGGTRASRPPAALWVSRVATINLPVGEVFDAWRDLEQLPRILRHLDEVRKTGERRSHWRVTAPGGIAIEWEAETIEDRAHEWIAWRSLPGASIVNRGSVRFGNAPGGRGTEVRVELRYEPPAGRLGAGVAWLLSGAVEAQVHEDLHRFKQLLETGDIPLSDGPGLWRAAQPAADPAEIRHYAGVRS